jgi:hypothetical protein
MENQQMSDLIQLTDAEIATVAGGNYSDPITASASATASYNSQSNTSTVTQSATASNSYSPVTAVTGSYDPYATTVAVGALASNTALVSQSNSIRATAFNRIRG